MLDLLFLRFDESEFHKVLNAQPSLLLSIDNDG